MSNYKIYGAIIKKEGTIGTGSTKNGNKFEEIVKELSQEVVDAQPEIIIPEVENSNITEGTLATATANRVVDMGAFNLDINTSQNLTFRANDAGNLNSRIATDGAGASIGTFNTGKYLIVSTSNTAISLNANGSATLDLYETGDIKLKSKNGSYKIGDDISTTPGTYSEANTPLVLVINPYTGTVGTKEYVQPTILYSLAINKGNNSLTSANNNETSYPIGFPLSIANGYSIQDVSISLNNSISTGAITLALKNTRDNSVINSYTISDASLLSSNIIVSVNSSGINFNSIRGVYLEVSGITGTIHGLNYSFNITQ